MIHSEIEDYYVEVFEHKYLDGSTFYKPQITVIYRLYFFKKRLWTFKKNKSVIIGDSKNLWLADAEYRCSSDCETKQKAYDSALSAMKKHIADVKRNTLVNVTKCNIESL